MRHFLAGCAIFLLACATRVRADSVVLPLVMGDPEPRFLRVRPYGHPNPYGFYVIEITNIYTYPILVGDIIPILEEGTCEYASHGGNGIPWIPPGLTVPFWVNCQNDSPIVEVQVDWEPYDSQGRPFPQSLNTVQIRRDHCIPGDVRICAYFRMECPQDIWPDEALFSYSWTFNTHDTSPTIQMFVSYLEIYCSDGEEYADRWVNTRSLTLNESESRIEIFTVTAPPWAEWPWLQAAPTLTSPALYPPPA